MVEVLVLVAWSLVVWSLITAMEEDFVVTEVVVVVLNSPRSEANEDPVADKQPRLLPGCTVLNGVVACHCVPLKISTATLVLHGTSTVKENVPFVAFAAEAGSVIVNSKSAFPSINMPAPVSPDGDCHCITTVLHCAGTLVSEGQFTSTPPFV